MQQYRQLPPRGRPADEVLRELESFKADDACWQDGRTWSLVYYAGEDLTRLLREAYGSFLHANGLGPMAFHSLQRMEADVVAIAARLLGGGTEVVGNMTSGGTESILMAVKTARDRARAERPGVVQPEMVVPDSAHPAFLKAAHYLDITPVRVPVDPDFRADVPAMAAAVTENTILLVGSAPSYPHGVVDPIAALAEAGRSRGVPVHVDACVGGFLLPFTRKLGYPVPDFDFRIPGVDSISADLHKYGYAAKGASVVLYRDAAIRRHQYFAFTEWSGGIYASPTMAGTRPGGAIAAAWAVMQHLGEEGYLRLTGQVLQTTRALMDGIAAIPGLRILGSPDTSIFAFTSDAVDPFALADAMQARGWLLDRQQRPASLHMMVTPAHAEVVGPFLADLAVCAAEVTAAGGEPGGMAALYGAMATIPDREMVREVVLGIVDEWTRVKG